MVQPGWYNLVILVNSGALDLLIFPALALVVVCSLCTVATLRLPTRAAWLVGLYLLAYANIVLVGQLTSSFWKMNDPAWWLLLHLTLAAGAVWMWRKAGSPPLFRRRGERESQPGGWKRIAAWPELAVMGLGVALLFLFNLFLVWIAAPNTNDSLSTHLTRVGYWLQYGSFLPWPSPRVLQLFYPVDMQLQMFWTVLFLGNDRLVEIVQWIGALATLPAIYGLARLLGAARPQATFAALLWATYPEIILESTTTQNDLVAGTLFAAMVYLFFLGFHSRSKPALALSGLALGLGLGTKQTFLFLIPGILLMVGLVAYYQGGIFRRGAIEAQRRFIGQALTWGFSAAVAFVLLGLYIFVVNQVHFGNPLGEQALVDSQTGGQTSGSLRDNLLYGSIRLLYQAVDPTGLPDPLTGYGFKAKARIAEAFFNEVGFNIEAPVALAPNHRFRLEERYVLQEDAAWYGLLFTLLVLPSLVYHLVLGLRRRDALRVSLFAFALTFLMMNAAFRPGWDPFQGRYFIPVVTTSTALAAFLYRPGWKWAPVRWLLVGLALVIAVTTVQWNAGKPVNDRQQVWTMDRFTLQTSQSFFFRDVVRMVEENVPADATLGLYVQGTYQEYQLFRENFSRRLVQIYPTERAEDVAWMQGQGIEFVLYHDPDGRLPGLADQLVPVAQTGQWMLLTWR